MSALSSPQSVHAWKNHLRDVFSTAGLASPGLDARVLLCAASGLTQTQLACQPQAQLGAADGARLTAFKRARLAGMPVSRIVGFREFYGLAFKISADVLDPRPDSEMLVEVVLSEHHNRRALLVDLGTGSGCLAISILKYAPQMTGISTDISRAALRIARLNAHCLGVSKRVAWCHGNWLDALDRAVTPSIIISNPPYIATPALAGLAREVHLHDPRCALDGGTDGLTAYRLLMQPCFARLARPGWAYFEIGYDQGVAVYKLMQAAGFGDVRVIQDLAGYDRLVVGKKR